MLHLARKLFFFSFFFFHSSSHSKTMCEELCGCENNNEEADPYFIYALFQNTLICLKKTILDSDLL